MKKRYILFEFLLIFIFLILPPLFVAKADGISKAGSFSPHVIMQLFIAIVLQTQFKVYFKKEENTGRGMLFKAAFWWSITLGCLMLIFALMQTLELFIEREALSRNLMPSIKSFSGWFFLVFSVVTAAFYEEAVYRQSVPELASILLGTKMEKKWVSWGIEFIAVALFAFSHRYLGRIPVINAFACGSILRLCYRKTNSVWTGTVAHFIYNLTLIALSILSRIH